MKRTWFQAIIFVLALALLFLLVRPIITVLLGSILVTYLFYPLYLRMKLRLPRAVSILATLAIVTLMFVVPLSIIGFVFTQQAVSLYNSLAGNIEDGSVLGFSCMRENSEFCTLVNSIDRIGTQYLSEVGLEEFLREGLLRIGSFAAEFIIGVPAAILAFVLMLFISYFLFRDGPAIRDRLLAWLPIHGKAHLLQRFASATNNVVFVGLLVAAVQGVLGAIGFLVVGIPLAVFWGFMLALASFVPTVGSALVWFPAALYLIAQGASTGETMQIWKGVGLILYGMLVIGLIDNILRVKLAREEDVHPLTMLIGVIGGVVAFGVLGVFLGPLLLVYFSHVKFSRNH